MESSVNEFVSQEMMMGMGDSFSISNAFAYDPKEDKENLGHFKSPRKSLNVVSKRPNNAKENSSSQKRLSLNGPPQNRPFGQLTSNGCGPLQKTPKMSQGLGLDRNSFLRDRTNEENNI